MIIIVQLLFRLHPDNVIPTVQLLFRLHPDNVMWPTRLLDVYPCCVIPYLWLVMVVDDADSLVSEHLCGVFASVVVQHCHVASEV